MDPLLISYSKPLQHVSTLCRQLVFDSIFISENIILLAIGKKLMLLSTSHKQKASWYKTVLPKYHNYNFSLELRDQRVKGQQN